MVGQFRIPLWDATALAPVRDANIGPGQMSDGDWDNVVDKA